MEPGEQKVKGGEVGTTNEEYLHLKAEHTHLDEKIRELEKVRFPSANEELEIKKLKKQKLILKTRMEKLRRHS